MFAFAFAVSARIYLLLQQYAPSNRLMAWLHRRENLKWGMPFMLLGAAYLLLAATMTTWAQGDGPPWAHLVFLVALRNSLKFLPFGPWSLLLLASACIREAHDRRLMRRAAAAPRLDPGPEPAATSSAMALDRTTADPAGMAGAPTSHGTGVTVSAIPGQLAAGSTVEETVADDPSLTGDDACAALAFAAEPMPQERPFVAA